MLGWFGGGEEVEGVGLRALIRETASVIAFLEWALNVEAMSGNGGFHLSVVPRSPMVPIAHM